MKYEQTLSTDLMYEEILKELTLKKQQFKILKNPLNRENLIKVIAMRPKILFLNCHGNKK
jgi:hypothetical protein